MLNIAFYKRRNYDLENKESFQLPVALAIHKNQEKFSITVGSITGGFIQRSEANFRLTGSKNNLSITVDSITLGFNQDIIW